MPREPFRPNTTSYLPDDPHDGVLPPNIERQLKTADNIRRSALRILNHNQGHTQLEDLIYRNFRDDFISHVVLNNPDIMSRIPNLQLSMQTYERSFEKQFANEFLTKRAEEYIERYRGMVEREGKMAGLQSNDRVIVVGGGSLPLTALIFNRVFDAQITCIDIDIQALDFANSFVQNIGMQEKISNIYGDGHNFPMKDFDLILVTCSMPKSKELFSHIFTETDSAKVIYRDPLGLYKLWYRAATPEDIEGHTIVRTEESNKQWAAKSTLITT